MSVLQYGLQIAHMQLDEIAKDGANYMKSVAPHPTGAKHGKGSHSTGRLARQIHVEKVSSGTRFITPGTVTDTEGKRYGKYAENGRGAISKHYRMKFRGADGKIHYAYHVRGMEGWHFARKTRDYLASKYT